MIPKKESEAKIGTVYLNASIINKQKITDKKKVNECKASFYYIQRIILDK